MFMLLPDRNAPKSLIGMSDVINVVEEAFRRYIGGREEFRPKRTRRYGNLRTMRAVLPRRKGVKWVDVYPETPYHALLSAKKEMRIDESSS
jgi:ornithine cyclodeaminase/alanine dehydrogenase-like protein (mu-crystallin family)